MNQGDAETSSSQKASLEMVENILALKRKEMECASKELQDLATMYHEGPVEYSRD